MNDENFTMPLEQLPVSSIRKIKHAGKDVWVMRLSPICLKPYNNKQSGVWSRERSDECHLVCDGIGCVYGDNAVKGTHYHADNSEEETYPSVSAVDLQTGEVYAGDWAVYAVAPKGSSFTLVVN